MSKLKPGEAYQLYVAIKTHFNSPTYDYFTFQGKTSASPESLEERPDRIKFEFVSRHFNKEKYIDFLVANFVASKTFYIADLMSNEANDAYSQRQKIIQSFSYILETELGQLFQYQPKEIYYGTDSKKPIIVRSVLQEDLSIESFIALDNVLRFYPKLKYSDVIWNDKIFMINKYRPFFKYNHDKAFSIIKKVYTEKYNQEKHTNQ